MVSPSIIELAVPGDSAAIAAMSRDYIETGLGWSWTAARVLRSIRDKTTNVAVLRHRAELLGFGIMHYGDEHAHLALLAIHLEHRQRGLASALLGWLEECAAVAGLQAVRLEARVDNPGAIAFYLSQGYGRVGSVPGYYSGEIDAVRLEKLLGSHSMQRS